jgi:hypothetical protein
MTDKESDKAFIENKYLINGCCISDKWCFQHT